MIRLRDYTDSSVKRVMALGQCTQCLVKAVTGKWESGQIYLSGNATYQALNLG
jgi:hypothetical protein